jgi:hypothetical protein
VYGNQVPLLSIPEKSCQAGTLPYQWVGTESYLRIYSVAPIALAEAGLTETSADRSYVTCPDQRGPGLWELLSWLRHFYIIKFLY